jgi:hypothetical protein
MTAKLKIEKYPKGFEEERPVALGALTATTLMCKRLFCQTPSQSYQNMLCLAAHAAYRGLPLNPKQRGSRGAYFHWLCVVKHHHDLVATILQILQFLLEAANHVLVRHCAIVLSKGQCQWPLIRSYSSHATDAWLLGGQRSLRGRGVKEPGITFFTLSSESNS